MRLLWQVSPTLQRPTVEAVPKFLAKFFRDIFRNFVNAFRHVVAIQFGAEIKELPEKRLIADFQLIIRCLADRGSDTVDCKVLIWFQIAPTSQTVEN